MEGSGESGSGDTVYPAPAFWGILIHATWELGSGARSWAPPRLAEPTSEFEP